MRRVAVTSKPCGATIYIDGIEVGSNADEFSDADRRLHTIPPFEDLPVEEPHGGQARAGKSRENLRSSQLAA
jgi:hypothetical protein